MYLSFIEILKIFFAVLTALDSHSALIKAYFHSPSIVQHRITMRGGRTVFGLTSLTTLFFETKSTLHCHHLPFFANTSSNTVHPSFVTELVGL